MDASAGSSGKGKVASYVTRNSTNCNFVLNVHFHQASHWVFDEDGRSFCYKNLNANAHRHHEFEKMYLANEAIIDLRSFLKEIEFSGIPRSKIGISPLVAVTTQMDIDYEKGVAGFDGEEIADKHDGTIAHGSTCSGVGATLARRILRSSKSVLAKDVPELADMICNVQEEVIERLSHGQSGLLELAQGFQLSQGLPEFYPYVTSRNITVASALAGCFLPVTVVGNVLLNTRAFPIRIASHKYVSREESIDSIPFAELSTLVGEIRHEGPQDVMDNKYRQMVSVAKNYNPDLYNITIDHSNQAIYVTSKPGLHLTKPQMDTNPQIPFDKIDSPSGHGYQDQKEITWDEVEEGYGKAIDLDVKLTSLTKLPRRVFTFSQKNLEDAIIYNQTPHKIFLSLNFCNWVDGDYEGENTDGFITPKVMRWIEANILPVTRKFKNAELRILGTGKLTGESVLLNDNVL